ncbi:MAG: sugar phosphate isomerase/epimerase [Deltaproteobacteria bacterium]|nr:sugar phosphate isomerase/epimerase [Deltaproteobacteria bacterium]
MKPKLVMCNIFPEVGQIKQFAIENGFKGIDWSFDLDRLPETPLQESQWAKEQAMLAPFEVRYHCPFYQIDLGHDDPALAAKADAVFRRIIRLVSKVGGRYLSIHIGLGLDSTEPLSWKTTLNNLRRLVQFGAGHRVTLCLENLAWGWTSKPNLFEKLIRLSGAGVTLDIGHAHVCESVRSQEYAIEDFVSPHADRVFNAHLYHTEVPGQGHIPPDTVEEIAGRLALLQDIGCPWWVIEIKEPVGLLKTKEIIETFLTPGDARRSETEIPLSPAASVSLGRA